ncbi:signal peptidase II [Candidatus Parabeggiatoa sp. HSG14]|uniref:signal peptidase II n=1 Tax=Candidatus Parabeggiatoa sp. HSG14 TaxID=3055593 RepID=UPI0025A6CF8A|nr:signal peptidase II [Thiotrichales bacterium HSG14]
MHEKKSIFPFFPTEQKGDKNALIWLWLSLLVVILDQVTKVWASTILVLYQPEAVLPFFNLRLMHNLGAAFSFLATAGGWQRWFLTVLALIISVVIIVWLTHLKYQQRWLACALALILGGALGNVVDRIMYGYVIDFIDIYYQQWHWPAFNLADSAISIGAVMLLVDAFWGDADQFNHKKE